MSPREPDDHELDLHQRAEHPLHRQASDTVSASSDVPQRQTSTPTAGVSGLPRTSTGGSLRRKGPPSLPPSYSPPPPNISAGFESRRSTRSNTPSSVDYSHNPAVKRKPLSSTVSAFPMPPSGPTPAGLSNIEAPQESSFASSRAINVRASLASSVSETSEYSSYSAALNEGSPSSYPAPFSSQPSQPSRDVRELATGPKTASSGNLQRGSEDLTAQPHHPVRQDSLRRPITELLHHDQDGTDDDDSLYDSIYDNLNTSNDTHHHPILVEQQPSSPTLNPEHYEAAEVQTATRVKEITITKVTRQSQKPAPLDSLLPKSPISPALSKIGTFFSWGSPSPSHTEFSSLPSPVSPRTTTVTNDTLLPSAQSHTTTNNPYKAADTEARDGPTAYTESTVQAPHNNTPSLAAEIEEMEDELKAISAELASSIRREMDLEDLADRLQAEINNPQAPGKRTSDYYSDSGISSAKFSEYDQTREEVERIQRKAEQDKAQLRLELTTKLQDEREARRGLEVQIRDLSAKASQMDAARMKSVDATGRLKELEDTCEDLRRKLSDERQVKDNFEDLLSVLKGELQTTTNERDNLRDEIVPQLRARVEGLEAQAAEHTDLAYEATRMQQDMESLRSENDALRKSREEAESRAARASITLSRSSSVSVRAAAKPFKLQHAPAGLSRSSSTAKRLESKEALAERLKDVEAQRDALHSALRSLLDRQEHQNRESSKRIRALEAERERLLSDSPAKSGYEKDIANLRNEVQVLRRRAEDAMEHKWQVEKGLIGLKMDLDRAEEEIATLRALLGEKDILIPPLDFRRPSDASVGGGLLGVVTSESLERAYRELQASYMESLERIKALEASGAAPASDEKTQLAMQRLESSLSSALAERNSAKEESSAYKQRLEALSSRESQHLENERALADELRDSAARVEQLAGQVQAQLDANSGLRQRLADAVSRGEADRRDNAERVTKLQERLRLLEDQLVAAQTASEDRVARHEAELASIREAHNNQLRRVNSSPLASAEHLYSPRGASRGRLGEGLSPLPSPMFPRSPRSPSPRLPPAKSIEDDAEVSRLRDRVAELERAVAESDREMQDVVERMSAAQIEVMTLQEEREAAVRETRKLQQTLEAERVKAFEERFKTLNGDVR